jgi:hypothetical protein
MFESCRAKAARQKSGFSVHPKRQVDIQSPVLMGISATYLLNLYGCRRYAREDKMWIRWPQTTPFDEATSNENREYVIRFKTSSRTVERMV